MQTTYEYKLCTAFYKINTIACIKSGLQRMSLQQHFAGNNLENALTRSVTGPSN